MVSSLFIIGIVVFIILINYNNKPYTIKDHHNDIMKDYDEEKWIKYQKTDEFKKNNL